MAVLEADVPATNRHMQEKTQVKTITSQTSDDFFIKSSMSQTMDLLSPLAPACGLMKVMPRYAHRGQTPNVLSA